MMQKMKKYMHKTDYVLNNNKYYREKNGENDHYLITVD